MQYTEVSEQDYVDCPSFTEAFGCIRCPTVESEVEKGFLGNPVMSVEASFLTSKASQVTLQALLVIPSMPRPRFSGFGIGPGQLPAAVLAQASFNLSWRVMIPVMTLVYE